jgi:hypothetical protein
LRRRLDDRTTANERGEERHQKPHKAGLLIDCGKRFAGDRATACPPASVAALG